MRPDDGTKARARAAARRLDQATDALGFVGFFGGFIPGIGIGVQVGSAGAAAITKAVQWSCESLAEDPPRFDFVTPSVARNAGPVDPPSWRSSGTPAELALQQIVGAGRDAFVALQELLAAVERSQGAHAVGDLKLYERFVADARTSMSKIPSPMHALNVAIGGLIAEVAKLSPTQNARNGESPVVSAPERWQKYLVDSAGPGVLRSTSLPIPNPFSWLGSELDLAADALANPNSYTLIA